MFLIFNFYNQNFQTKLNLELILKIHYNDDRLILRELTNIVEIPNEFQVWNPSIELIESLIGSRSFIENGFLSNQLLFAQKSIHLDPKTGQITILQRYNFLLINIYRIYGTTHCITTKWKYPFEKYFCELKFDSNSGIFLIEKILKIKLIFLI